MRVRVRAWIEAWVAMAWVCAALVAGLRCAGAEVGLGIWVTVDGGERIQLSSNLRGYRNGKGGVVVSATGSNLRPFLAMEIPSAKAGTYRFDESPGMSMYYGDFLSSDMRHHFSAAAGKGGTAMEVKLTRVGGTGELLEGEFVATVASSGLFRDRVVLKGRFLLRMSEGPVPVPPGKVDPR